MPRKPREVALLHRLVTSSRMLTADMDDAPLDEVWSSDLALYHTTEAWVLPEEEDTEDGVKAGEILWWQFDTSVFTTESIISMLDSESGDAYWAGEAARELIPSLNGIPVAILERMVVEPRWRRQGVGSILLRFVLQQVEVAIGVALPGEGISERGLTRFYNQAGAHFRPGHVWTNAEGRPAGRLFTLASSRL